MTPENPVADLSGDFEEVKRRIVEETSAAEREWEKVSVLASSSSYCEFLSRLTGAPREQVKECLDDFVGDNQFRAVFGALLREFETNASLVHGDVRFHSLTLYVVARLAEPTMVVETGVASGKSSALLLLALQHNGKGRMVSIDLPNPPGDILPDGALTHTGERPVGWLVPDYLRPRWELRLGDARTLLPQVVAEVSAIGLFFHDSLHTREHVLFELRTVAPKLHPPATVLVDNVDIADGAFESFVAEHGLRGVRLGDMGGARVDEPLHITSD